jgi:hypothetical protein
MINQLEVARRAQTEPKMDTLDFDMGLFRKTQDLTQRYHLNVAGTEAFWEVDQAYADAVYQAGVDLLTELGVFCVTTNRVVKFTEDEVKRAAREIPRTIVVGDGADRRILQKRGVEDPAIPPCFIVAGHSAWSDHVPLSLPLAVRATVTDPRVCAMQSFMYAETDGYEITGPTHWAYGARRAFERVRAGCTLAGRPGLCVIQYPTITQAFGVIAAMDPARGIRPTDGTLFSIQPDLHIETDYIAASYVLAEYGLAYKENQGGGSNFIADIYGSMIVSVASRLAAWMCYRDNMQGGGSASPPRGARRDWGGRSRSIPPLASAQTKDGAYSLWLNFAAFQALHRNTGLITKANIWGCHEMAVEQLSVEYLLMQALSAMQETLWGNHFHFAGSLNPPSVIRWAADVSDAVRNAHLRLSDYKDFSDKIYREKLHGWADRDPRWANTPDQRMKAYADPVHLLDVQKNVYDFYTQTYSPEYLDNEQTARRSLQDLGLDVAR